MKSFNFSEKMTTTLLEQGKIFKKCSGKYEEIDYKIRLLDIVDNQQVSKLQNYAQTESNEYYHPITQKMQDHALAGGYSLGVFVADQLIAFRLIYIDNLMIEAAQKLKSLVEPSDKLAFFAGVVVLPAYRANHLNKRLYEHAFSILKFSSCQHLYTIYGISS